MPSLTYVQTAATTAKQLFGYAKSRTAWTIYNQDSTNEIYWANQYLGSYRSGFRIPPNTAFTLKIPEDDPAKEVWIISLTGTPALWIYEGFAEK